MTQTTEALRSALDDIAGRMPGDTSWLTPHLGSGELMLGRLVMAVAGIGDPAHEERALQAAGQIELTHAGALMHDDLMDRSVMRRGRATLWQERGAHSALCAGVTFILWAYAEIEPASAARRHELTRHLREIARGQTDELTQLFATTLSPEAYLRRAYAKKGALYELAARLGAWAGDLDPWNTHLTAQYAAKVGTAFQLVDDVCDFTAAAMLGRAPGTDLRVGVYTWPVLQTLAGRHAGGERLRSLLREVALGGPVDACVELLHANGALDATLRRAKTLVYEGLASIWDLRCVRARMELEAYAWELIGSVRRQHDARHDPAVQLPAEAAALDYGSIDPALRLAAAPGAARRLARLAGAVRRVPQLAGAIAGAGVLVFIADEVRRVRTTSDCAALAGSVDLLLAEVIGQLASLPGAHSTSIAKRLAGLFLEAALGRAIDDDAMREFAAGIVADAARC